MSEGECLRECVGEEGEGEGMRLTERLAHLILVTGL